MNIYYSLTLCQCTIIKETCRVPVLLKNAPDIHTRAFINIFSMNYLCILFFNKDRKFVFAAGMALKCSWYLNIFKHIVTLNSILFGNKNFRKFRTHFLRMVSSFKLFSGLNGLWVRILGGNYLQSVYYTRIVQIIRNIKHMNSSFVGHGSKFMLDVDKFPGAVDALCFSDSFVDSLIERWRFSIFVSCKDETVFLVFDGTALEARSWFSLANSFWLSSKDIFLCIRFRITDGFLLPKNRSSTFKQPFFLSRSMLSI